MNRERVAICLKNIRTIIESARDVDERNNLRQNYNGGIKLCDDMIKNVEDRSYGISENTLLGQFTRYTVDSLPWTGDILVQINKQTEAIRKEIADKEI